MTMPKADKRTPCDECDRRGFCPMTPWIGQDAQIAIVGEAPGSDEIKPWIDKGIQGTPFVGRAGKLLHQNLRDVGIDTDRISKHNALSWRPPGNRDPKPFEMQACNPRLMQELERVDPDLILAMGNYGHAAVYQDLSKKPAGITNKRGTYGTITLGGREVGVLSMFHPSFVLRSPEQFWEFHADLVLAKGILDGEVTPVVPPPYDDYWIVETQADFDDLISQMETVRVIAVDLETIRLFPWWPGSDIFCIGFSWEREQAAVLDWQKLISKNTDNFNRLKSVLERVPCAFHNGQFDVHWLWSRGISPNYAWDTMLGHFLLDERQGTHALKRLAINRYRAPSYDDDLKQLLKARGTLGRAESRKNSPMAPSPSIPAVKKKGGSGGASGSDVDRKQSRGLSLNYNTYADPVSREAVFRYNGADADYTYRLIGDEVSELRSQGMVHIMPEIMIPAAEHFIDLEMVGIRIDRKYQEETGRRWIAERDDLERELRSYPGAENMNFDSPVQVSKYLFEELGLEKMKSSGTILSQSEVLEEIEALEEVDDNAREYWQAASSAVFSTMKSGSTNTYMLYWLGHQHPFPMLLTRHRNVSTKIKNYYYGWMSMMERDRLHPSYRLHGTRTARMSSTNPNIHGMPRLHEIKRMVIADPGYVVIYVDYSQAEIRMLAHLSHDEILRIACDGDIHREVSKVLFHVTDAQLDAMDDEQRTFLRRAAKTIAFGIIYGRGSKSLAPQLGVSVAEAEAYRVSFLDGMPDARRYIAEQRSKVSRTWEVQSLHGFKRRFPKEMARRDKAYMGEVERQAVNMPIQAGVSIMTTLANLRAHEEIDSWGHKMRTLPWPHIHDGFGIQVPEDLADRALETIIEISHDVGFETDVHFATEVHMGTCWGDLETVYNG